MKNLLRISRTLNFRLFLIFSLIFSSASHAQQYNWVDSMMAEGASYETIKETFYNDWSGQEYVKGHGWKQFHRWEAFWETRLLPDGSFPDFKEAFRLYNAYTDTVGVSRFIGGAGNWSPLGPFNYTNTQSWSPGLGRVNFIVEDPNNSSILYVGAPAGGIWKSIDAGSTWVPLGDEISVIGISAIAISAANSNVIYLATGDADGGDTYSIGVMKSTDGGLTWLEVGNLGGNLRDIVVDPTNENIVYVASNGGVYKSVNGGNTWNQSIAGSFRDVELRPSTPATIYAATSTQLWYSTNSGTSWTQSTGLPAGTSRLALAVTPANTQYVYVLAANGGGGYQGIYRSTNSGVSFTARNTTTDVFEGSTQSWYDMAIGASATNANTIFTGCLNVWRSTNGGSSLTKMNNWSTPSSPAYTHADIHFLKGYGGNFYCGSDGGIYRTTDNGLSFTDLTDGIQISQFYRVAGSPNDVTTISGGLQDNGGYIYNSGSWKVWYGADGMEAAISPTNSNLAYGMIQYGSLYRTTTGGGNSTGLGSPEAGRWVTPMQYDPNNARIVAGYNDLHEYNGGWNQLSTFNFPALLRNIEFYDGNSNVMYVSTNDRIYRTTNNGTAFTEVTNNLTGILSGNIITSIEVDPADQNRVWVSISGWTAGNKVAYTANGGTTWSNVSGTIPNLPCNIVKYEAGNAAGNSLYVGMDIGIYYRDDVLGDFIPYMNNLPNVIVNDLELNEANSVIRAGTYGRGVWESGSYNVPVVGDDAGIPTIIHPVGQICGETFIPEVTLRNFGTNILTQVEINYQVNAGPISTYNWTGSLAPSTSEQVFLPSLTAGGANTFTAYTTNPNAVPDLGTSNDTSVVNYTAIINGTLVYTQLIEDCWGSEVTWDIIDGASNVVFSGGPYSDGNPLNMNLDSVCLAVGCYDFVINDSYGDGVFGSQYGSCNDDGDYYVITENNDTLVQMPIADFGFQTTHNFCVTASDFADFTWTAGTLCPGSTVTFTDASAGATTWDWNFGPGATPATATGAGPHDVTYATSGVVSVSLSINGGLDISNQDVTISPLDDASYSYSSAAYCSGDADPSPTITGLAGGTFSSLPAGLSLNTSSGAIDLSLSAPGTYTITYLTSGACPNSSDVVVAVNADPAAPTISAGGPTTFCAGGSVTLTSSQGAGNTWSTAETTSSINVTTSGSYTVTYMDGNGCSAVSAPTAVTVNALPATPTISAGGPTTFCAGGSVTLTSSQGSGNLWSTTEITSSINVTSSGSYFVTYTDGNGCSAVSASTVITVNANPPAPTISASGPTTFCAGGSVTLTSSQGSGNTWSTTETTTSINVTTSGSYSVTYMDGNGCTATSTPIAVTVNASPPVPIITAGGPTTFCAGGSVTLTSSQGSGNTWSTTETTSSINVTTSGSYSVTYIDGNGCSAVSAPTVVTVNANPASPTITAGGPTTFCAGGSVTLTSSQGSGNTWSTTETTSSINVNTAGSYTVTYTDGNGCSAISAPIAINVNASPATPTISAGGPLTFCAGGSVTLTSSEGSGNTWSTTETTTSINVTTSGSYTVTYTDGNGCTAVSAPTAVVVNALPVAPTITAGGPTTFCAGGSVTLTSSQGTGNTWSTTETTASINVTTSGSYSVTYVDGNGCSAVSAVTNVTVNANPAAPTITAGGPTTFCSGGSVTLTSSEGSGNTWSTTETTASISVTTSGSYTVTYTDGNGCSALSSAVAVTVNPTPVITAVNTDPSSCGSSTGTINVTGTGTGDVTWSGTASGSALGVTLPYLIGSLPAGSYTIDFVSAAGCASNTLNEVLNDPTPPATPIITPGGPTTFCAGGSVTLTSSYPTGNTWSTTETTAAINVTTSGSYSVTYTDGSGCSSVSAPIAVTVNANPAIPTITASGPATFCSGSSVTLTSSQGSGNTWSTTETTASINVTTTGSYSVVYVDGNGCFTASAPTNVTVNPTPTITSVVTDPSTCGTATGSIQVTGIGTGDVTWSGGASGSAIGVTLPYTITSLTQGSYTVDFVTNAGCPSNTLNVTLSDPTPPAVPTITAGGPTTFCAGGNVTLTSSQGSGNTWSTTETTSSINVSASGAYTVTYTDGSGCSSVSLPTIITVNPSPTIASVLTDPNACLSATGSIQVIGSGTGDVSWSGASSGSALGVALPYTIPSLTAGSYTVDFTSSLGCPSNTLNETLNDPVAPAAPIISAGGPTTFCAGGNVTLTSSYGSGNVWSTAETTTSINSTTSGSYTVTYTDGAGCSSVSLPTVVTVNALPAAPTISAGGPTSFCVGGSVNLTSSQSSGNLWSSTETTQTISATSSGSYSVTYTDGNGCSAVSALIAVNINANPAAPIITAGGPTTFCAGGNVTLTSSQGSGNTWSTTETTSFINVSASGSYTVSYTDGNGCSAISTPMVVTVNANPAAPIITAGGPTTFCAGGSVSLTSSQGTGNLWSTTEVTPSINVSSTGSYSVTYTDGNGCSAVSAPIAINVNANPAAPTITAGGPTTFCSGGSVILTSSQGSGNVWSTTESTSSISITSTGSYTVTYTDGNGCSAVSAPIAVTVNATPSAPMITAGGPTTFCAGGSVTLTSSEVTGNVWSTTESTQVINVSTSGSYNVTYTDGNGCFAVSAPIAITVNANPVAPTITAGGPTTFCDGGNVILTSSQGSGNTWSTSESTASISTATSGSYTVTYVDGNGCSAISAPIAVTVNANPVSPVITPSGPLVFCEGGMVTLTSSESTGNVWSTSESTAFIDVTTAGTYTVTYTDGNGCFAISSPINITINALPTVDAGPDQDVCAGAVVTLSGAGAVSYTWDNGAIDGVGFNPLVGIVTYTVTGIDVNGCENTDSMVLSAFTPPTVDLTSSMDTLCPEAGNVTLAGTPSGGTYSGTGVTGNLFDPAAAGLGSHVVTYDFTDGNGCSGSETSTIFVQDCSSIDEDQLVSMQVFPNPTTGTFVVQLVGSFEFTIHDARGRIVRLGSAMDEVIVDLSYYEAGVYLLNVTAESGTRTVRILKH